MTELYVRHAGLLRWVWIGLALVLAACNQGDDGGGGPAY